MIDSLLEKKLLPDWLVRLAIHRLLAERIRDESARHDRAAYVADLKTRPLAEATRAANEQHYEVPTPFYQLCPGRRLKYSGCLYPTGAETLDQAEEAMLALNVERAQLADGQHILELGCGWGSLSLYLQKNFPARKSPAS
jgi:cyclopropane-fatty-acyl-phospholipid synthase